jgi:hypothetical protein
MPHQKYPDDHAARRLWAEVRWWRDDQKLLDDTRDPPAEGLVDWSYLDAIERREIDVSKFPKWARRYLSHIRDPEPRKFTEQMLAEQFSNKSLYDDAYFEEEEDDGDDLLEEGLDDEDDG